MSHRRILCLAICFTSGALSLAAAADDPYARFLVKTEALTPSEQQRRFRLPDGFVIELVAAEPAIKKPTNMAFDSAGRLLVTGSVEYPQPVPPRRVPRDAIYRLSDTDSDGVFDQTTVFAAGLNLPMGVAAIPSGVIAFSIPSIDFFSNEGAARRALFSGFASDDTHGMVASLTPWIDGWIYATHGEGNVSRVAGADGQATTLSGGHTFRFRSDGSRLEIFAHGQANPFGLAFDPRGDLFSADSHSRPAMLLLRGGWYAGIGSRHDGLGLAPVIMDHYHGSTGIAGIAYYADDVFPAPYRGTIFIGNPATGRVNHDALEYRGSTPRAVEKPDFLSCDDPWFRPVDLKLGPDGALYIADFYDRVIAHNVVPAGHAGRDRERGRIWRVRFTGNRHARPPLDLSRAASSALFEALGHPNLTIRTLATHEIVFRVGTEANGPLRKIIADHSAPNRRVHALWAAAQLKALDDGLVDRLASDSNSLVRLHLVKALSEILAGGSQNDRWLELVRGKLADSDPFVRRAAADALGRHPARANVKPLLDAWTVAPPDDPLLVHTFRMAVRDNLRALDEIRRDVANEPKQARLVAQACLGLPTVPSARFLLVHLQSKIDDPGVRSTLLHHAARYLPDTELDELYAFARSFRSGEPQAQGEILRALFTAARERNVAVPKDIAQWAVAHVRRLLESGDEFLVQAGIESAWTLGLTELSASLTPLADRKSPYPELRTLAIDALAALSPAESIDRLAGFLADAVEPAEIREKAADALAKIPGPRARDVLLSNLPRAPYALALTIARQLTHTHETADLLLVAVAEGRAPRRLLLDPQLDQLVRDSKLPNVDARLADLRRDLPHVAEGLESEIVRHKNAFTRAKPDASRGQAVFDKHCAVCHAIAGRGAMIGPSLDGLASRGLDRLLEDLLNPNLSLDPRYRATLVAMKDGTTRTGMVVSDDPSTLVLADADGKQARLPWAQIESQKTLNISPMPVANRLADHDLHDLIAFLLCRELPRK